MSERKMPWVVAVGLLLAGCASGPGDAPTAAGLTECGGASVDLQVDRANCGACGVACAGGELCRQGNCLRWKFMVCGTTGRAITEFIPADLSSVAVAGCAPDSHTQALFVSRYGAASLTGPVLQPFLNNGGIVLTEYSTSNVVWQAAFATTTVQGARLPGSCSDAIPAVVQFSPSDPFWRANAWDPIPLGSAGCGYAVQAYAGLTPLMGWDATNVAVGYRDLGSGRLWATDFDWSDGEIRAWHANTRKLMGYMATHRR